MERIDQVTFKPYFAQVSTSSLASICIAYAVLTVINLIIWFSHWNFKQIDCLLFIVDPFYTLLWTTLWNVDRDTGFVCSRPIYRNLRMYLDDSDLKMSGQFMYSTLGLFYFQFDQIYASALNLKWNDMTIREQQMYKLFIQRSQNPALLSIGGYLPLNLDSCVTVCFLIGALFKAHILKIPIFFDRFFHGSTMSQCLSIKRCE